VSDWHDGSRERLARQQVTFKMIGTTHNYHITNNVVSSDTYIHWDAAIHIFAKNSRTAENIHPYVHISISPYKHFIHGLKDIIGLNIRVVPKHHIIMFRDDKARTHKQKLFKFKIPILGVPCCQLYPLK